MFKGKDCQRCGEKVKGSFDYCPYCGLNLSNPKKDLEDFGMIGKSNKIEGYPMTGGLGGFGITDKMINSIFRSLMKNIEGQMKSMDTSELGEVQNFPNGIRIQFGVPGGKKRKKPKNGLERKDITEEQIKRMYGLPRIEAKTNVRRLADKVVYELLTPGVDNIEDVFVQKLESGYEIKAIGKKKVYVNSIPVNLPLRAYSISEKGLNVEFGLQ